MSKQIRLSQGKFALVDDADFDFLSQWKWTLTQFRKKYTGYAYTHMTSSFGTKTTVKMHRFLLGAPNGTIVDHINGDGLDNRRANLRITSQIINQQNRRGSQRNNKSSGVLGVTWDKAYNKWKSQITANKKHINIGRYNSIHEAKQARLKYIQENRLEGFNE